MEVYNSPLNFKKRLHMYIHHEMTFLKLWPVFPYIEFILSIIRGLFYYQLFTIFHKYLILLLIFILHFPNILALYNMLGCLMLLMTYYAQNYAGIIGGCLCFGVGISLFSFYFLSGNPFFLI